MLLLQGLTIGVVQGGKVGHTLHFHLRQLLLRGDHLVFYIGNGGLYRLDGALRGVFSSQTMVEGPNEGTLLGSLFHQGVGFPSGDALIAGDDAAAYSVNGAKLQPLGYLWPKEGGKALPHVLSSRYRVGHGENGLWGNATPQDHISNSADQDGGLTAAWNGQQQHRAVQGLDGSLLLCIQGQPISMQKLRQCHMYLHGGSDYG